MAGSADSSPARRNDRADGSISYPRPVPEIAARSPGVTEPAHAESGPCPWRTISTSSSSESGSNRRGVSVRMTGRLSSLFRNSLPLQVGTSSSAPSAGSRSRTLAAGSPGSSPTSAGPASVIPVMWGLRGSTRATSTGRNVGGSRRLRIEVTASSVGQPGTATSRSRGWAGKGCRARRPAVRSPSRRRPAARSPGFSRGRGVGPTEREHRRSRCSRRPPAVRTRR